MKHLILLFVLLATKQYASGQFSTRQLSLCDPVADSAILFNKFDNRIVVKGWKPGMEISFSGCTVQQLNGDTFNVKANFTGTAVLVVKNGDKTVYKKSYQVRSHLTASVNTGLLTDNATKDQILESLLPMHKSALHNRTRFVYLPKVGDPYVVEIRGAGKTNNEIKAICSRLRPGDKVIIEFPEYRGGKSIAIR